MTRMLVAALVVLAAVSFPRIGIPQTADAPAQLAGVKVTEHPQSLMVGLETSGPVQPQAPFIDSPRGIVIDMNGTYAAPQTRWNPTPEPIKETRGSQLKPGTARLVVELARQAGYRIQEGATGLTLTFDASDDERSERAKARAPKSLAMAAGPPTPAAKPDGASPSASKGRAPTLDLSRQDPPGPDAPKAVAQAAPPGSAPAPAAPGGKLITIDFKDADVINVIRLLGAEGGRNIVVGEDVKGKVSVSLRNVTWDQALETILEARALQKIEKDGIIRIVSREQLAKEREALAKAEEAKLKAEIEVRTKIAEAELKEQQVQQRKLSVEAAAAEAQARGPLKEAVLRLAYADPGEVANTLQGVLGLGAQPIA